MPLRTTAELDCRDALQPEMGPSLLVSPASRTRINCATGRCVWLRWAGDGHAQIRRGAAWGPWHDAMLPRGGLVAGRQADRHTTLKQQQQQQQLLAAAHGQCKQAACTAKTTCSGAIYDLQPPRLLQLDAFARERHATRSNQLPAYLTHGCWLLSDSCRPTALLHGNLPRLVLWKPSIPGKKQATFLEDACPPNGQMRSATVYMHHVTYPPVHPAAEDTHQ